MIHGALKLGRAAARARMTETITAGMYEDATDPETLNSTRTMVEQCYPVGGEPGIARVAYPSRVVSERDGPSMPVQVQTPYLSIPTGSPSLPEGTEVHVTGSTADESLIGRRYKVDGSPQAGQTTALRFPLKELS